MKEYHKIQSIFKRDPATKYRTFIEGDYSVEEFKYLKDNKWIFTEKVDGTNIRVGWDCANVTFGGRKENSQIPTFLISKLQELFTREKFKEIFPETPMTLYGEGYGAKIQKSGENYISDGVDFVLFDVSINDVWLKRKDVEDIANKLNIKIVPIVGSGTLQDAIDITKKGFKSQWGDFLAEGLVLRPEIEMRDRLNRRIITKVKHKDFETKK